MEERLFMNGTGTESADLSPSFVRALTDAQLDLFASICVMLGNRDAAKDVLQDTNVALMKHALEYDEARAFLPWAKAFAFNQARTYRKRESRSPMVFDDDLVAAVAEEVVDDTVESGRELELLETCLGKLTAAQKKLIQAHYFQRERVERIAERMTKSTISVYVQIHRIRRLLGACIEGELHAAGEGVRA